MPTYSYVCEKCGHSADIFQKITEEALNTCTKCGQTGFKRQIGKGAGFIFKGSGFYITDYRSKEYTEKAKSEESKSTTTETKSTTTTGESAAKAESTPKVQDATAKPA